MFGLFGGGSDIQLDPKELKKRIDAGEDLILLDVREDWEHSRVKIPGAKHIPLGQLNRVLEDIHKEATVVVYCHHGARSLQACMAMKKAGYEKVQNLKGGIDAYSIHVDPSLPRY